MSALDLFPNDHVDELRHQADVALQFELETRRLHHDASRRADQAIIALAAHLEDDRAAAVSLSIPEGWIDAARHRERIQGRLARNTTTSHVLSSHGESPC